MKTLNRMIEAIISGELLFNIMTKGLSNQEKKELTLSETGDINL